MIADAASCVVVLKAFKAWAECGWQSSLSGEETASNQEGGTILTDSCWCRLDVLGDTL